MRTFALAAVLAVVGGLGFADRANAQIIVGTRGTPDAALGYYSPYPGTMYSPFRAPAPVYSSPGFGFRPNFNNGVIVAPNYYYANGYPGGGFTVTQFNTFGRPAYPQYGYGPHPRGGYRRW
jgi:hypothetical protein